MMKHYGNNDAEKIGTAIVLMCGIAWGLGGVLGQILFVNSDMSAGWLSFIRMIFSGVCIVIFGIIKSGRKCFEILVHPKDLIGLILFSLFGLMPMQYTYFAAVQAANAATATVLQYTYPILILVLTSIQLRKLPRFYEAVAAISAFLGILIIATHGKFNSLEISPMALFWGLASSVSFVIYTVAPKKLYEKYSVYNIMGFAMLLGGCATYFVSGCYNTKVTMFPTSIYLVAVISIVSTLFPMVLYGIGVQILGNIKASLFVTVEPIFCALLSGFLGLVTFGWSDALGFALIIIPIEFVAIRSARSDAARLKSII